MTPRPLLLAALAASATALGACASAPRWSAEELAVLGDLRRAAAPLPPDPTNRFADDEAAARLGQRLFFDARLSANGAVACATCHVPARDFQDDRPLARGVGTTSRRTMPIAGVARQAWFFWDGRKDSLWSQALGPLESEVEHGGDRLQYVRLLASAYGDDYARVFGPLPDLAGLPEHATPARADEQWDAWQAIPEARREAVSRAFANLGKAIAAYERRLEAGPAPLDRYLDAIARGDQTAAHAAIDPDQEKGLRLFIGKARCVRCHNGPELTNGDFANTGVPAAPGLPEDAGRVAGASEVLQDEFNCRSRYSDAAPAACRELAALRPAASQRRQFKVPSLRGVAGRAPYMHAGQLATLEDVIAHYDRAPAAPAGHSDLEPLGLSASERRQLRRFLEALSAPLGTDPTWLAASVAR